MEYSTLKVYGTIVRKENGLSVRCIREDVSTCWDGVKNGSETGVDCGGPDCISCLSLCFDGVKNGNETGIDCGGSDCKPCPTCTDGVKNGNETGIDCGGSDCVPCPTCNDGVKNGSETGVDCGGPDCNACPTCTDGVKNQDETDVDCGGTKCPSCSSNSVEGVNGKSVMISPNPGGNNVTVTSQLSSGTISIVSLSGAQVSSSLIDNNITTIDVSGIADGVYNLRILDNHGVVLYTEKLVIAH